MEPTRSLDSPASDTPAANSSLFAWAAYPLAVADETTRRTQDALVKRQQLERDLLEARTELSALHRLIEEIPQIFERKFQDRLQPVLADNAMLRSQLRQLQAGPEPAGAPALPPAARRSRRIRRALRHAFGLPQRST